MTKKLVKWRIRAANGVVLGIVSAYTQLEAWQKLVKELRQGKIVYGKTGQIRQEPEEDIPVTSIEPGLTFDVVDDREWRPTHTIRTFDGARIDVVQEQTESPLLLNLFTRDEWLAHRLNRWTLVNKRLHVNGKEVPSASIEEKRKRDKEVES